MPTISKKKAETAAAPAEGVMGRIRPVSEVTQETIKISIYGRSGTGKTTFACTFPKPLLLLAAEEGLRSVHSVQGVDYVRLENTQEVAEVTKAIKNTNYRTIVLDTASSLQEMLLKEIVSSGSNMLDKSWGLISRDDWGRCSNLMRELLWAILNLSCNAVICSQEREFNSDSEGSVLLNPHVGSAMIPSVTSWLNPACDYIVQTCIRQRMDSEKVMAAGKVVEVPKKTDQYDYCLRVGPNPVYTTKIRRPKGKPIPEFIVDPDYEKFYTLLEG